MDYVCDTKTVTMSMTLSISVNMKPMSFNLLLVSSQHTLKFEISRRMHKVPICYPRS